MNYIPSWLNDTYTLLQKLQKCIEKIENISNKEIPDAIKPIQDEINNIETEIAAIKTIADNAFSLAKTNETDIATLDGQVASLETDCAFVNKVNTFTKPQRILRDKNSSLGFAVEERSGVGNEYDFTDYSHGHITKTKNNKRMQFNYNLPDKSGDIALKSDITTGGVVNGQEDIYAGNGDPAQVKLHAGSTPDDAYLEIRGGSGAYVSRIYPMKQGAHRQVDYILPDTNNQNDTPEEQHLLSDKNVKTIFGNKSIYGSGNIDLYKHDIEVTFSGQNFAAGANVHIIVYSSKNTVVDSLTDLKTLLGSTFMVGIFGEVLHNDETQSTHATPYIPLYADQNGLYFIDNGAWFAVPFGSEEYMPQISDTVTTV